MKVITINNNNIYLRNTPKETMDAVNPITLTRFLLKKQVIFIFLHDWLGSNK